MAKYSSPTTRPTSPWRASRPILPAEVSEFGKVPGVFDVGRRRIAMHDDRLVLHKCTASFVVAPDALCFRVGRCAPEDTAEHLQDCVDPARLVNGCHPIAFNTRDKQDDKNPLQSSTEDRAASGGLRTLLRHPTINIDRWPRSRKQSDDTMPEVQRGEW
jgi:hypothetical protein